MVSMKKCVIKKMIIREARLNDVPSIVNLNYELFQEDAGNRDPHMNLNLPREGGDEHFTKLITGDRSVCFLAESTGKIVGYLAGYIVPKSSLCPIILVKLESIYVKAGFRGLGAGTKLKNEFLKWSKKRGAESISVNAYASNERALEFYRKIGFKDWELALEMKFLDR